MPRPTFRFAPSPNGLLHLGHAYSALLNFDMASQMGGRFLLRIEDIDRTRCRPEWISAMLEDLSWLGISWELPPRQQSEHFAGYALALDQLASRGLLYCSRASRAEIDQATRAAGHESGEPWPRDPDGAFLYPRSRLKSCEQLVAETPGIQTRELRIQAQAPLAQRLDMPRALSQAPPLSWQELGLGPGGETGSVTAMAGVWGDVVLARKEFPASYHIAVVVDDAAQGVTHVVRGQDLFQATSVHRLLQHLLELPTPLYYHHPLLRDDNREKLSKSVASKSLKAFRAEGATPGDIRRLIGL